jgi:hypothetical protein
MHKRKYPGSADHGASRPKRGGFGPKRRASAFFILRIFSTEEDITYI